MNFYVRIFSVAILFCLNVYCNNAYQTDQNKSAILDSSAIKNLSSGDTKIQVEKDSTPRFLNLKTSRNIDVLSMDKEMMMKGDTTDQSYVRCKSWTLTIDELKSVIRKFDPISSEVQNLSYSYMPCRMTGTVLIDSKVFKYSINAGSTLTLANKDTTFYFGCSNKECEKFFITGKE